MSRDSTRRDLVVFELRFYEKMTFSNFLGIKRVIVEVVVVAVAIIAEVAMAVVAVVVVVGVMVVAIVGKVTI